MDFYFFGTHEKTKKLLYFVSRMKTHFVGVDMERNNIICLSAVGENTLSNYNIELFRLGLPWTVVKANNYTDKWLNENVYSC